MTTRPLAVVGCLLCLTASLPAAASTITLGWNANTETDLAGYKVYYATHTMPPYDGTQALEGPSPIDVPLTSLADPSMPSLAMHGMPSCTTFFFAVTAYNMAMQESAYSMELSATAIATPTSVAATPDAPGALHITWVDPPADDSGTIPTYRVYYDLDSGMPYSGTDAVEGPSPIQVASSSLPDPANPSFDLTGLTVGTTYYIAVEAACDNGAHNLSTEVSAIPQDTGTGGASTTTTGNGGSATTGTGGASGTTTSGGPTTTSGAGGSSQDVGVGVGGGSSEGASPNESSGCGCRVVGDDLPTGAPFWGALGLGALAFARRARRRDRNRAAR